jgi:histidinol-phosphatase (PHP family)
MKTDGHTHTQYCLHGSMEETELFILRAIELGFDSYSVTEHPPLPSSFKESLAYNKEVIDRISMKEQTLNEYITHMYQLKKKYKDKIMLKVGLEIDYLPDHCDWVRNLLNDFGPYLDDSLISVHFLKGKGGYRCVDLQPSDVQEGLISEYNSYEGMQLEYYRVMEELLYSNLGANKPKRIGHYTLCRIFQHTLTEVNHEPSRIVEERAIKLLEKVKEMKYALDFNVAGLYKPYCLEPYPYRTIVEACKSLRIPLIYGSDSHSVKDIGRAYDIYEKFIQ